MRSKCSIIAALCMLLLAGSAVTTSAQRKCSGDAIFSERNCVGDDIDRTESNLLARVNAYRKEQGKSTISVSADLSVVANRHLLDLVQNVGTITHSWSNCPYDIRVESTWTCVLDAPGKFPIEYRGEGYETLYHTDSGSASPEPALEAWKKSNLHNSIILNLAAFAALDWDAVGVAVNGPYAALWFGSVKKSGTGMVDDSKGLGVSLEKAVDGLGGIVNIKKSEGTVESGKWTGTSPDGKVRIEILGTHREVSEASARLSVRLEADGSLSRRNREVLSAMLRNVFPQWDGREAWLDSSLRAIGADHTVSKTQLIRKIAIQLSGGASNTLILNIRPESKPSAIEF